MARPGVNTTQITITRALTNVDPVLAQIPRKIRTTCIGAVVCALDWQARRGSPVVPDPLWDDLCLTPAMVGALTAAGVIRWDAPLDGWIVNPEFIAAAVYRRPGYLPPVHPDVVRFVFERDSYRCVDCGTADDLTCDHRHPRASGGVTDSCNLVTRCRPCNARKGSRVGVA